VTGLKPGRQPVNNWGFMRGYRLQGSPASTPTSGESRQSPNQPHSMGWVHAARGGSGSDGLSVTVQPLSARGENGERRFPTLGTIPDLAPGSPA
jgi:hypothetical protein